MNIKRLPLNKHESIASLPKINNEVPCNGYRSRLQHLHLHLFQSCLKNTTIYVIHFNLRTTSVK